MCHSVMVREATVRNLALLISHFRTEEMIKYNQAEELLFRLLWYVVILLFPIIFACLRFCFHPTGIKRRKL